MIKKMENVIKIFNDLYRYEKAQGEGLTATELVDVHFSLTKFEKWLNKEKPTVYQFYLTEYRDDLTAEGIDYGSIELCVDLMCCVAEADHDTWSKILHEFELAVEKSDSNYACGEILFAEFILTDEKLYKKVYAELKNWIAV